MSKGIIRFSLLAAGAALALAPFISPLSHAGLQDAIKAAEQHEERILIAGSLFLIGQARAHFTEGEFQASEQ